MPAENPRTNPVHYPTDRRLRIWIQPRVVLVALVLVLIPVAAAWIQFLAVGLPEVASSPPDLSAFDQPSGFPSWVRVTHYVNFLFLVMLVRSGLSILMDHPRLYWNDHCTPGTEWMRFTPLAVPDDRVWTAKEDARYLSPWLGLPGYRHTIGTARHWHFLSVLFWLGNGLLFVALLFWTNQWKRLVPTSWQILPDAWSVVVNYATCHLPEEPNGFFHFNPLQQLAYFGVVFIFAPLSLITGLAMSPALDNRFGWYPKLFGGRQCARSIHFLLTLGYVAFLILHVAMVAMTGLVRNMNHIVLGTDDTAPLGLILGLIGIAGVVALCMAAHCVSWSVPRAVQRCASDLAGPIEKLLFGNLKPCVRYNKADISPRLWANGKVPTSADWLQLQSGGFQDFRLKVYGLVENPVELSLAEMRAMRKQEQITMHHCIQGWSGIAAWGGLPLRKLIELAKPMPDAKVLVFHSFGEGLYGGEYYDTLTLENALYEQSLLAYEMNFETLPTLYGAPLRLRAENQLGHKMVKWIKSVEFVSSEKQIGKGHGGKNEDDEYFPLVANI